MSAVAELSWSWSWEDDVTPGSHAAVAALLGRCFPRSSSFTEARSWASGRPERRLVGRDGDRVVAHLAILRRFLQAGGVPLLVGDVGLVAADPDVRGRGVGAALLARAAAELRELQLPFGFLTCGEQVAPFYAGGGWVRVDNPLRMVRADGRVQAYGAAAMVLPVLAPMGRWPAGVALDRNGWEL